MSQVSSSCMLMPNALKAISLNSYKELPLGVN